MATHRGGHGRWGGKNRDWLFEMGSTNQRCWGGGGIWDIQMLFTCYFCFYFVFLVEFILFESFWFERANKVTGWMIETSESSNDGLSGDIAGRHNVSLEIKPSFILKDLSAGFQPHRYAWNGESVTMLTTWTVCVRLLDVVCPNTSLQALYVLQRTLGQTWMSQNYGLQIHGFSKQKIQRCFELYHLKHNLFVINKCFVEYIF